MSFTHPSSRVTFTCRIYRVPSQTACLRSGTEIDCGTGAVTQLQMSGHEVGMKMGQEDVLDLKFMFGGELEIPIDIALWIDDGCDRRLFVSDNIGSMGQAIQIELFKDHQTILARLVDAYQWNRACGNKFRNPLRGTTEKLDPNNNPS